MDSISIVAWQGVRAQARRLRRDAAAARLVRLNLGQDIARHHFVAHRLLPGGHGALACNVRGATRPGARRRRRASLMVGLSDGMGTTWCGGSGAAAERRRAAERSGMRRSGDTAAPPSPHNATCRCTSRAAATARRRNMAAAIHKKSKKNSDLRIVPQFFIDSVHLHVLARYIVSLYWLSCERRGVWPWDSEL